MVTNLISQIENHFQNTDGEMFCSENFKHATSMAVLESESIIVGYDSGYIHKLPDLDNIFKLDTTSIDQIIGFSQRKRELEADLMMDWADDASD